MFAFNPNRTFSAALFDDFVCANEYRLRVVMRSSATGASLLIEVARKRLHHNVRAIALGML